MTTDDAPRPALDAATLVYGRERWEALNARWHSGPLPWDQETAQAVHWMARHADTLLAAAAEREALAADRERARQIVATLGALIQDYGHREWRWGHTAGGDFGEWLRRQDEQQRTAARERLEAALDNLCTALAPAAGEGAGDGA